MTDLCVHHSRAGSDFMTFAALGSRTTDRCLAENAGGNTVRPRLSWDPVNCLRPSVAGCGPDVLKVDLDLHLPRTTLARPPAGISGYVNYRIPQRRDQI